LLPSRRSGRFTSNPVDYSIERGSHDIPCARRGRIGNHAAGCAAPIDIGLTAFAPRWMMDRP